MRFSLLILIFFAAALSTSAALPGDAAFRKQELFLYRQKKMEEFEKARQQREEQMIRREQQIRIEMASPPWRVQTIGPSGTQDAGSRSGSVQKLMEKKRRKWVGGMMTLLFIAGGVRYVQILTNEPKGKRE